MSKAPAGEREREKSQTPSGKRWWRIGRGAWGTVTVIGVVIGLVAALITIWQVRPRHDLGITFTNPPPNAVTPVSCVFTVTGRGSSPTGQTLLLSNEQQGTGSNVNATMYFVVAETNPGTWQALIQVGNASTPGGTPFTLTTWLVNADWINYLTQITPNRRTWWGAPGTPPGAKEIQSVTVSRTAGKCS